MGFRLRGLDPAPFVPLFGRPDAELARRGIRRVVADAPHAFPDRIALRDAQPGETLLLLNHVHQPAETPYRASHAIFVREGARIAHESVGQIPDVLRRRLISLRAFDTAHEMVAADCVEGDHLAALIGRMLDDPAVSYCHAHFARRGCYACLVERA